MDKRLDRLKDLTDAAWQAAALRLASKTAEERTAAAAVDAIRRRREEVRESLGQIEGLDLANVRAATSWLRWSEAEVARLNGIVARKRAQTMAERAQAARAFGRNEAAGAMLRQQEEEAKRIADRRRSFG